MARYTPPHDSGPIIEAARNWASRCLVGDGSMLGEEPISTAENFDALDKYFVRNPNEGSASFYEKLEGQLAQAPSAARKLMAEVLWALFLFPSNIGADTKRDGVRRVWEWSGESLDPGHPLLTDELLDGIGSAGMGVNTNRWREVKYMVGLGQAIKAVPSGQRAALFDDYARHMDWIETVPQEGERQFRHMLRYFLFPDRVERMSSNRHRWQVLEAFNVDKRPRKWTDRQLDEALFQLRQDLEKQYETPKLDFYRPPLVEVWRKPNDPTETDGVEGDDEASGGRVEEPDATYSKREVTARNRIFYGPPGTGKTWRMKEMFREYRDDPADLDPETWKQQLVARYGWRAVIAAALAAMKGSSKVSDLEEHPLVKAKATQRRRTSAVRSTLWGYMQQHATPSSTTVNVSARRAPYIFDKDEDSSWFLVDDWEEQDGDAKHLLHLWRAGPATGSVPVKRYRMVTFHPSYSYEDFVIGLRPVASTGDGGEAVGFQMVDGVFKQACEEARSNPGKRYALFIDEINRANIAKVFGELITLIESDKRAGYDKAGRLVRGMEVQLPGTGVEEGDDERFGVPENLDIIGTMNTADRSIALLDIALRRRFEFEEFPPRYNDLERLVEGVHLGRMLQAINDRLEFLADRDRLIGHSYFMGVRSLDDLRGVFRNRVIPLLQEYFFDDWSRVELVLSGSDGRSVFIRRDLLDAAVLFGPAADPGATERQRYLVSDPETWDADAFVGIYERMTGSAELVP